MKKIRKHLIENEIKFEDKSNGNYSPYLKFMIDNIIYVVTDYSTSYEICTLDRKMIKNLKTQKSVIKFLGV